MGLPAFILAGSVHEFMHAWTAKKLGDYTATLEGRLTLNPLAHLDPIGTFLMIIVRFGWMKPVPINEYNFANPVRGTALTALAGPASNLAMAILAAMIYRILNLFDPSPFGALALITLFVEVFTWVNVALMLFNLIPVPPLDGYRIFRAFLPKGIRYYWEQAERYAPFILLAVLLPISPLSTLTLTLISRGYLLSLISCSLEFHDKSRLHYCQFSLQLVYSDTLAH